MKQVFCMFIAFAFVCISNLNAQSLLQANSLYKEDGKYYLMENGQKCLVNDKVITVKIKEGIEDTVTGVIPLRKSKLGYIDVKVPDSVSLEDFAHQLDKSGNYEIVIYNTYAKLCAVSNDVLICHQWYLDSIRVFDA